MSDAEHAVIVDANGVGGRQRARSQVFGTIGDDDNDPLLSMDGVEVTEGAAAQLTVTMLDDTLTDEVTVKCSTGGGTAVAPGDYSAYSVEVVFAVGQTSHSFSVATASDGIDEDDETFRVTAGPRGWATRAGPPRS